MAWPLDAIHKIYTGLVSVPSANLNQIQARIVDLSEEKQVTALIGIDNADIWSFTDAGGIPRWGATGVGGSLYIKWAANSDVIINRIRVKYYLDSASGLTFTAKKIDTELGSAGSTPTTSTIWTDTPSAVSPPEWGISDSDLVGGPVSESLASGDMVIVSCTAQDASDAVYAVTFNYQPVSFATSPTP